jgi:hypothetical protein
MQGMYLGIFYNSCSICITSDLQISISHSPKGWTDQELGELWMIKDFEPATSARNMTQGHRLLILDGHNSHCTYGFCKFAADHKIIIICLPSHTTHALQPCNVACFGPLASAWKSEVNSASADYVEITKQNLLVFYGKAMDRALKKTTIMSAFVKTGIWPLNRHILDPSVFEPSKNTTTEPSQPLPARLPMLLIPNRVPHGSTDPNVPATENEARYIIPLPPVLHHTATRPDLRHENHMLRDKLHLAEVQLEKDFTQMKLMDSENGRLRKRAFAKEKKKTEKRETTQAHARLMTGAENLDALAEKDFMKNWKEVTKELAPVFKRIRKGIADHYKDIADANKNAKKAKTAQERAAKKATEAAEKVRKQVAREEAAATRAIRGRGHGARRGYGGASRGWGHGRERGRGTSGIELEGDSEGEFFDSVSSSTEYDCGHSEFSDAAMVGDDDQLHGMQDDAAVDIPLPPVEPRIQPRPRPRPKYRIPAPIPNEADVIAGPVNNGGPQSQVGGALAVYEVRGEARTGIEDKNVAENGRRYPRRSNRTNLHFIKEIDG